MLNAIYSMFRDFYDNPVIQRLSTEKRWTISDSNKVPIDMADLLSSNGQVIHGAILKENHCPYLDLWTLLKHIPNATNHAFYLDARTDGIMVLDIEPKCPQEIVDKLLQLPAFYGEYSMSGKGYHLILPVPSTFVDVFSCMNAVKEEHGYYEFLCNHYVTFTRKVLPTGLVPNMGQAPYDDFITIWNQLAVNIDLDKKKSIQAVLDEEEDTEYTDYIQEILKSDDRAYKKEPSDFFDDMSRYEYGFTSHTYHQLMRVLRNIKVFYTLNEMIWEVFRTTSALIEYRPKHDEMRNNLPWLLYLSSEVVGGQYNEDDMRKIANICNQNNNNSEKNDISSMIESEEADDCNDYCEDSSSYNPEDIITDDADDGHDFIMASVSSNVSEESRVDNSEIDYSEFESSSSYNAEFETYD